MIAISAPQRHYLISRSTSMASLSSWSPRSEADRVFPRNQFAGTRPSSEVKQLLRIASRRGGIGSSRVIEVVHLRTSRAKPASADVQRQPPTHLAHAETWSEGFHARSAPMAPPAIPADPVLQVGHLIPSWEPLLPPLQPPTTYIAPLVEVTAATCRTKRLAAPDREALKRAPRHFADPFDPEDTGSNCIRCGYLIETAAERTGLVICSQCR